MNSFKSNYPVFSALILLVADFAKNLAVQGESMLAKVEGEVTIVPSILSFIPQASGLGAEVDKLKASPTDCIGGVELLVTDLAFSSERAQAVMSAAFPLADSLVVLVPQVKALVVAIKS